MKLLLPFFILLLPPALTRGENPAFDPERLEKEVLVSGLEDSMEMEVLLDGRILVIERHGALKLYSPATRKTVKLGTVPTAVFGEVGLNGLAAAPDFATTGFVYLFRCPADKTTTMRVSRFTVRGDKLLPDSEKKLLEFRIDGPEAAIHMGGGLAMDSKGNLYVGAGDNSPPIPELPVDQRVGHEHHDALRTAANSNDLRGKILRIHPEPDGSYTIPPGNLFPAGDKTRPEIYCMGCRNPFRIQVDRKTDWLYWGDVGQNVIEEIKVGPNGYDEVNQARAAGNFGWPMFTGPNEAYSEFDFDKRQPGLKFDPAKPLNRSKNNTGLKELPPPQPAFLWYPTQESDRWPQLGSGGRSIMAGPVYYHDAQSKSAIRLPETFDRSLFICEWMRNWIMAVKLDANGNLAAVTPFALHLLFRRPIDLRIGPDGALHVLEYGDRWSGNSDGQITRIAYRRGNRPPIAVLETSTTAGKQPLTVKLGASKSFDKDPGDRLTYSWSVAGQPLAGHEPEAVAIFTKPGTFTVTLTVTDSHGASNSATTQIHVGNAAPKVQFTDPPNGGFYDWGQPVAYKVVASDEEDGSTAGGTIPPERVVVRADYQVRRRSLGDEGLHAGLALMRKTTCFACHTAEGQSKGPPYVSVAQKYRNQKDARELLAKKVVAGGTGVWGSYPMPPHPQHTLEQTRLMVDWVLSLTAAPPLPPTGGTRGAFTPKLGGENLPTGFPDGGVQILTATYTDNGAAGAPPLTGEATVVLHARKKKAAYHDFSRGVQVVDDLEDEHGMIAWCGPGDYLDFAEMNLAGIDRVTCRVRGRAGSAGEFEIRTDSPTGPLLARVEVPAGTGQEVAVPVRPPAGVHDLYFVATGKGELGRKTISLNWVEFHDSPAAAEARKAARATAKPLVEDRLRVAQSRPFVRNWTVDDLRNDLPAFNGQDRSPERGAKLFAELSCAKCHKMGQTGGAVGPDLTDVMQRMAKQKSPREALLIEILEPSKVIDEKYRTQIVTLDNGQTLAGIIVSQDAKAIRIAANPANPEEIREIPRARIEEMRPSDVSLMPTGLLNTLTKEEILDLLAYVGSGGKK
ncbi:MAG: PQQ-dependent sugar dehydrogenase [Gemmataceae bacterium]